MIKKILLFLYLLFLSASLLYWLSGYQFIFDCYTSHHPSLYKAESFGWNYFSQAVYKKGLLILLTFNIISLALFIFFLKKINEIHLKHFIAAISSVKNSIRKSLSTITGTQGLMILFIFTYIILYKIYCWYNSPIGPDEVFSAFFFSEQGLLVSATYYPAPNNHILFSILGSLLPLKGIYLYQAMRLFSLLSNLALLVIIFIYIHHRIGFTEALLSLLLCGILFGASIFGVQGRGYMLISLFSMIGFISLREYIHFQRRNIYLWIFCISSALGFYTIPVFMFPFLGFAGYGILQSYYDKKILLRLLYTFLLCIFFTLLLYLPLMLISGTESISANKYVTSNLSLLEYISFFKIAALESAATVVAVNLKGSWIILSFAFILLYTFFQKNTEVKRWGLFLVILCFSISLFLFYEKIFPFYRVWTPISFFVLILFSLFTVSLIEKIKNILFRKIALVLVFLSFIIYPPTLFSRQISGLYFPGYKKSITDLYESVRHMNIAPQKNIMVSDDAFYIRYLLEKSGNDHLLSQHQNYDKASIIVIMEGEENLVPFPNFIPFKEVNEYRIYARREDNR